MAAQPTTAPVLSGPVPPLAAGFTSRQETGLRLADGFRPGELRLLLPLPAGARLSSQSAVSRSARTRSPSSKPFGLSMGGTRRPAS